MLVSLFLGQNLMHTHSSIFPFNVSTAPDINTPSVTQINIPERNQKKGTEWRWAETFHNTLGHNSELTTSQNQR